LNTPFAKLAARLSSATVITGIFHTGRMGHTPRQRLQSLRARSTSCHSDEVEGCRCNTDAHDNRRLEYCLR
jgi:hypothetical protein